MSVLTLEKPKIRGADLPYEDGVPLESSWHLDAMYLLIMILRYFWRDRSDIYIGGNMFVYFDPDQDKRRNFRGPDFFVVKGVKDINHRNAWVIWEEEGLAPCFVIELASATTVDFDLTGKKNIYEQELQTPEYVVYNPLTEELRAWRLAGGRYVRIAPNHLEQIWSEELGLWFGVTEHQFARRAEPVKVLRFFDKAGRLLPTEAEAETRRAEQEARRAEQESAERQAAEQRAEQESAERQAAEQRAEQESAARKADEAELARLRAMQTRQDKDEN